MATITGTAGPDVLPDTVAADTISGLAGNDTITVVSGVDAVDGGDDIDRLIVNYGAVAYGVVNKGETGFDNATSDAPNSVTFSNIENVDITTGSGDDTVRTFFITEATTSAFTVVSGDDTITTGAGNDRAAGGNGNDMLFGGEGNDVLDGDGRASGKIGGAFRDSTFIGDDELYGEAGNDTLYGGNGSDILDGGIGDDILIGDRTGFNFNGTAVVIQEDLGSDMLSGDDTLIGGEGNDILVGNAGDDTITGGIGNDTVRVTVTSDDVDMVDLGDGADVVEVTANGTAAASNRIRLTFTSSEVGNGNALDAGTMANQDGGLGVRLQSEVGADDLVDEISRYDDEGITFVAQGTETFDVRDLPTGTQRGDAFQVVGLGTSGADVQTAVLADKSYYFNAGMGDDTITGGNVNDFLVGGAGNDTIDGGAGNDGFLGGAGDDILSGGDGNDTVDGGAGNDIVGNQSQGGAGQDILIGGDGNDTMYSIDNPASFLSGVIAPERDVVTGGNGDDTVTGGRLDSLDGGAGTDRLLLNFGFNGPNAATPVVIALDASGTGTLADGTAITGFENFNFNLTEGDDTSNTGDVTASISGEGGNDTLTTGAGDDVVFGGSGNDILTTGAGDDTLGGGEGDDTISGGMGDDSLSVNAQTDGSDSVDLGEGFDSVNVSGNVGFTGQVRLTFTSSEVGNGNALDGNTLAGQDGDLAVRFQLEDGSDGLTGPVSRYDDEGIEFVQAQQGLTFDVRDLVSGAARGDQFVGVVLGTSGNDALSFFPPFQVNSSYYYNAGMGNDTVDAGTAADFLVGGGGLDTLNGNAGDDKFIGGGGNDALNGGDGLDTAIYTGTFASFAGADLGQFVTITAADGTDTLTGIEILQFTDGTINLDDGDELFDTLFYYSQNPDVFAAGFDALAHYQQFGEAEGRDPNAFFDVSGYLAVNPDVAASDFSPLEHYRQFGDIENRDIGINFDSRVYLANNADVAASGLDPLTHYLIFGQAEGRASTTAIGNDVDSDTFDATYYLLANPDVAASDFDARTHFTLFGQAEGRDPNFLFDTSFYLASNPDVAGSDLDPLTHYNLFGADEGRDPSEAFDTSSYLDANPDVAGSEFNPLFHYLEFGIYEGRSLGDDTLVG